MNKIYELIYAGEDMDYSVALSSDKSKLEALIERAKQIENEYSQLCDDFDESVEDWQVPEDYPLYLIEGFDPFDWRMFYGYSEDYAQYFKIVERNLL